MVSKDQVYENCFKRNIRSITLCVDTLSYLCEYLELLGLSRSIWFSFHPYALCSCILSSLGVNSIGISFISPLLTPCIMSVQCIGEGGVQDNRGCSVHWGIS